MIRMCLLQPKQWIPLTSTHDISIHIYRGGECITEGRLSRWTEFAHARSISSLTHDPAWLRVFAAGMGHTPYCVEATQGEEVVGLLPLAFVKSPLFGRFLVSLPYINSAGVLAGEGQVASALVDRAVALADELDVRYLELRHETPVEHSALGTQLTSKVHMRLALPGTSEELWKRFDPKVRNQIRKGEKQNFEVIWGCGEVLADYYDVFARNMRDLGTPVFGKDLFRAILDSFPDGAEFCVVRLDGKAIAAALLTHGQTTTEVPSASALREFNVTNANMFMYWQLLQRAIARQQQTFDFGRSTVDSNTYRFKKQWGAEPHPAVWQYYVRQGTVGDMRIEGGKYDRMIRTWQRLPVWLTRLVGPAIVRGIP